MILQDSTFITNPFISFSKKKREWFHMFLVSGKTKHGTLLGSCCCYFMKHRRHLKLQVRSRYQWLMVSANRVIYLTTDLDYTIISRHDNDDRYTFDEIVSRWNPIGLQVKPNHSSKDSRIRWLPFKVTAQEPNAEMTILLVPVQTFLLNETRGSFLFRKK